MSECGQSRPGASRGSASRILRAAALCGALALAGAGTATAQGFFGGMVFDGDILPPRVVAWRLAERGFTGLSRPRFDGRVYVVEAVSPGGAPVRLFLDPGDGAIVGRQRLAGPETYARLEPPRPGFGWTDEDAAPRRAGPPPLAAVPPGRAAGRPGAGAVPLPDGNPYGMNPDGAARSEAPRRLARTSPARQPDVKPALRTSPEAPAPTTSAGPGGAERQENAKPDAVTTAPRPDPAEAPVASEAAKPSPAEGARAEVAAEGKGTSSGWKDLPAEGRRPVRVIGGATVVPGQTDRAPNAEP